jgi:hypothetical protein
LLVLAAGAAFLVLFLVAQWLFSAFLISHSAENWFFATDRHWGYREAAGEWRNRFWSESSPKWNPPLTPKAFVIALLMSIGAARVGLWLGNGMTRVRR